MELSSILLKDVLKCLLKDDLKDLIKEAIREVVVESQSHLITSTNNEIEVLDRTAAAKFLNISLPTLDVYTKEGVITGRRIGKKIFYRKDELVNSGNTVASTRYKRRQDA